MMFVEQAKPNDLSKVRALIVRGLTQRWGQYEPSFNPDLETFGDFYADALVLVARTQDDQIIGCGILIQETENTGRIVRMSVMAERQRTGIGTSILKSLLERANALGYKDVVLETTAAWESANSFYTQQGFVPTREIDGDQHFQLVLKEGFRSNDSSASG